LGFAASFVSRKLIEMGLVPDRARADELFLEFKRFFALCVMFPDRELPMCSARVDEAWHQFALFTTEYAEFCQRFAGRFVHHQPAGASPRVAQHQRVSAGAFRELYEAEFGPMPSTWFDELALAAHTRLARGLSIQGLEACEQDERAQLAHTGDPRVVVCRAHRRTYRALSFIAREPIFLVRELPGLSDHNQRAELLCPLVRYGVLRVAP
jgi:hypothetical protein